MIESTQFAAAMSRLGAAVNIITTDGEGDGLVYFGRSYHRLAQSVNA